MGTLALIGHGHKMADLASWAQFNREPLSKLGLIPGAAMWQP